MLNWLGRQSIRKPICWLTVFFIIAVINVYMLRQEDIPPGIQSVLMALVAIPCAVVGSSSYEATHMPKEGSEDEQENPIYLDMPDMRRRGDMVFQHDDLGSKQKRCEYEHDGGLSGYDDPGP
jgi:hypothetical protein